MCNNYALGQVLYIFRMIMEVIQIIVPILLIVSVTIELIRMMINPDEKKYKKSLFNKFFAAFIIFFIPLIVSVIINMVDSNYNFVNCYKEAKIIHNNISSVSYVSVDDNKVKKIIRDDNYEKGNKDTSTGTGSSTTTGIAIGTVNQYMEAVKNTVITARNNNYHYGDSRATPPTTDKKISCDRLEAKALWDIGYTDQRTGGEVVSTLDSYLTSHGWRKSTNINDCKYGSIVLVSKNGTSGPPYHAFTVVNYDSRSGVMTSYDEGAEWRIHSSQPFTTTYYNQSLIYGVYNMN